MGQITMLVSSISVTFLSFFLTWIIIKLLSQRLLDLPSSRSSHTVPTPRGGGIALASATLTASIFIFIFTDLPIINVALIILTMAMAVLGALGDFLNLAVRSRLLIQIVLSSVGVYLCIAGFSDRWEVMLGFALLAISVVWLVNLYNFMDGINGIAAIQAICTSGAMAFIF